MCTENAQDQRQRDSHGNVSGARTNGFASIPLEKMHLKRIASCYLRGGADRSAMPRPALQSVACLGALTAFRSEPRGRLMARSHEALGGGLSQAKLVTDRLDALFEERVAPGLLPRVGNTLHQMWRRVGL
jgi:hypothetical protein